MPHRNSLLRTARCTVATAHAADGADVGAVAQPKHLHTSVTVVKNSNVAIAVDGDAVSMQELSVASSFAADGANMGAVAVAQHLHAMAAILRYNNVPSAIKRNAPGLIEPPYPCSIAVAKVADAAQVRPVTVPQDLNAMVVTIAHYQVALAIKSNAAMRTSKLPISITSEPDDAHEA